jgi:hypothetical protein
MPERIERIVREWPNWSEREQEHMDAIVDEVLECCRSGAGTDFIYRWCAHVLGAEGLWHARS